jgi:hypothetical protein
MATGTINNVIVINKQISVTTGSNGYCDFGNNIPDGYRLVAAYAFDKSNYIFHLGFNGGNQKYMAFVTYNGLAELIKNTTMDVNIVMVKYN